MILSSAPVILIPVLKALLSSAVRRCLRYFMQNYVWFILKIPHTKRLRKYFRSLFYFNLRHKLFESGVLKNLRILNEASFARVDV